MRAYTLAAQDISEQANIAVDLFLGSMKREGVLTNEQVELCRQYRIVYAPTSMWGRLWKYISGHPKTDVDYTFVVKIVNVVDADTEDSNEQE